jgi:hypothetical protein
MPWLWLVAAIVQGALVLIAGWAMWKQRQRNVVLAGVLICVAVLIVAANAIWMMTGGPTGRSWIGMRGGMPGLWLSNIAAVELFGLALLALGKPRSWR